MSLVDYPVIVDELVGAVTVTTTPAHAPAVTLFVVDRCQPRHGRRWVVSRSQDGTAVVSEHAKQEVAVRSAIYRARRYASAYSVPRGLAVTR
jgi:hypothetical protein